MRRRYRRARRRFGSRRDPSPVLLVTEDERGVLLVAAARLIWLFRSELAPFFTTGALTIIATWAHARHPGWAIPFASLTVASVAVLALPWSARWLARRTWFDRLAERLYAASVVALGGMWLAAATAWGPGTPPLPTLAWLGTLSAGVPWWAHRRRRARVRVERTIEAWPQFSEAIGLPGSRLLSATVDRWGWSARLSLRRGQTARQAIDHAAAIESALGVRPGAVRIETDPHRADRALMRVVETDPHAQPIPWPGIPTAGGAHAASMASPIDLGVFEDGSAVLMQLLYRNTLVGGVVGSGKSGVLNVLLAALVACLDVVVWGIDLKGGMELRPWAACLGRLATTGADAVALLADAVAELQRRTAELTSSGQRLWRPSRGMPALLVVVDEYAELPDNAHPYADSLARLGRAVAVNMLAATQRPTQQAMGRGAVRSQMDNRLCLRVRERRDVDLVLGQGMYAAGWRPDGLDAPGKFLISTPEHTAPRPARAYLLSDADVRAATARCAGQRPAITGQPPAERDEDQATTRGGAAESDNADPDPAAGDPERALWEALRNAPADGVTVTDLVAVTGMSRRWVYYRLHRHAAAGRAAQSDRGRWRAATPEGSHDA
jgi:S-DNA-T family DNA segregation ATPase FtsK/SpoIIIE